MERQYTANRELQIRDKVVQDFIGLYAGEFRSGYTIQTGYRTMYVPLNTVALERRLEVLRHWMNGEGLQHDEKNKAFSIITELLSLGVLRSILYDKLGYTLDEVSVSLTPDYLDHSTENRKGADIMVSVYNEMHGDWETLFFIDVTLRSRYKVRHSDRRPYGTSIGLPVLVIPLGDLAAIVPDEDWGQVEIPFPEYVKHLFPKQLGKLEEISSLQDLTPAFFSDSFFLRIQKELIEQTGFLLGEFNRRKLLKMLHLKMRIAQALIKLPRVFRLFKYEGDFVVIPDRVYNLAKKFRPGDPIRPRKARRVYRKRMRPYNRRRSLRSLRDDLDQEGFDF